jgi:hypothetical protein
MGETPISMINICPKMKGRAENFAIVTKKRLPVNENLDENYAGGRFFSFRQKNSCRDGESRKQNSRTA